LRTYLTENVNGEENRVGYEGYELQSGQADVQIGNTSQSNATTNSNDTTNNNTTKKPKEIRVTVGLGGKKDNSELDKHPLLWQIAAQVSSLPTRLMALVTTPSDNPVHTYTESCDGKYATEDWLTGQCKEKKQSTAKCDAEKKVTACKNYGGPCQTCTDLEQTCVGAGGTGQEAQISDGVIALAWKVSQTTCTPAAAIIGVLAKESGAQTFDSKPLTGDPNQMAWRDTRCQPGNYETHGVGSIACGPFSFGKGEAADQINEYRTQLQKCLDAVGVTDTDERKLGVSMCVASAWMWRGIYCYGNFCSYSDRKGTYGCDGNSAKSLSEVSDDAIRAGISSFHCNQLDCTSYYASKGSVSPIGNYMSFVSQFKAHVEELKPNADNYCSYDKGDSSQSLPGAV
jgi:hypothetical protein